jgi:hypothetical protein
VLGEVALEVGTFVLFAVVIPAALYGAWLLALRLWRGSR